jgi:hypothetical protein
MRPKARDDRGRVSLDHHPTDVAPGGQQPGDQVTGRPALDLAENATVARIPHESSLSPGATDSIEEISGHARTITTVKAVLNCMVRCATSVRELAGLAQADGHVATAREGL